MTKESILRDFEKARKAQFNSGNPYFPNWDAVKAFVASAYDAGERTALENAAWAVRGRKHDVFHDECINGKAEPCDYCLHKQGVNSILDSILSTLSELEKSISSKEKEV